MNISVSYDRFLNLASNGVGCITSLSFSKMVGLWYICIYENYNSYIFPSVSVPFSVLYYLFGKILILPTSSTMS